jgi:hypothetical protein
MDLYKQLRRPNARNLEDSYKVFPTGDGLPPIRYAQDQQAAELTEEQLENLSTSGDFFHRTFNLQDEADSAEYTRVMTEIVNMRYYQLDKRHDGPLSAHVIYLEWVAPYRQLPKNLYRHGS